ncbi:MAG: secretin N-terminal domain-containing protein [Fuerstiella sp.]
MDAQSTFAQADAASNKKDNSEAKGGDKKDGKKEEQKPDTVSRPMLSDVDKASPLTDQVKLNGQNEVTFNLHQQPWQSVLQWIADTSKLSLDWQELPGDTLNLTTTRAYSLAEARDILNRHLLTRGYTMVLNGELLSVMKLSELKSSLVPRIAPADLNDQLDHTLCKVSFDLNWLIADEAVSELTPLLSNAGKISKMSRTNRLEIMDTAGSLKDIYQILESEQSDSGAEQLVKTFRLKHRRAGEVIVLLRELLGVDPPPGSSSGGSMSSGGMSQMTSMMRQMQQQMQQGLQRMQSAGGKSSGGSAMKERETRLVLNPRENMLLVQAMPDQMAIIEKAIEQIDVAVAASDSLIQNLSKMKVYRLNTVDPQTLVDLLQELGDLAPGTVLKVDKEKNSIVAFAAIADHLTITTLVERLDQSGRNVEVIPLRRLDAEYVAGTIRALMGPEESSQSNNDYGYNRYSSSPPKKQEKDFKVEADVINNRLLVFANKIEMDEIRELLKKLGEIPDPDAVGNGIRVFDVNPGDDPAEIMQRLQQLWKGDNPLQFEMQKQVPPTAPGPDVQPSELKKGSGDLTMIDASQFNGSTKELKSRDAQHFFDRLLNDTDASPESGFQQNQLQLTATEQNQTVQQNPEVNDNTAPDDSKMPNKNTAFNDETTARQTTDAEQEFRRLVEEAEKGFPSRNANSTVPPVKITMTPDGRLVVSSDDPMALMQVEDLLKQLMKPTANYKVFRLKYATASWLTLNLEDYFKAEQDTESGYEYDDWYGFRRVDKKKSGPRSLGQRRDPTFIYDNFTSTILVRDADRKQLQVIEDLIAIYDVPEPAENKAMRLTKIFKLKNAKAEVVAQAVKDVFRDLLSANDKALESKDEKSQNRGFSYFGSSGSDSDDGETPIRFKGLLSIGFDKTSDTLIISSSSSLMETVEELVLALDEAADTAARVQVVKVNPSVDIRMIQEKLSKLLGQPGGNAQKQNPKNQQQKPQQAGNRPNN